MENQMFCFQCQETFKNTGCIKVTGCTVRGVCGKLPETSRWQDLLISVLRGLGTIGHALNESGVSYNKEEIGDAIVDGLFACITNANFDDDALLRKVDKAIVLKRELLAIAAEKKITLPDYQEVKWVVKKLIIWQKEIVRIFCAIQMPICVL